jgi:hypothetical protein
MMGMVSVENVINAYRAREASGNWAEWASKNEDASELLNRIAKEING